MRKSLLVAKDVAKEQGHTKDTNKQQVEKLLRMAASKAMVQSSPKNTGTYTYSSQPRAVQQEKYREE